MGMYDYATVEPGAFFCSAGHDLHDEEWQTKDFECVLGYVRVGKGSLTYEGSGLRLGSPWPGDKPYIGRVHIYTSCSRCPVLVQAGTGNLCPLDVTYELEIIDNKIRTSTRISEDLSAWLVSEPTKDYMRNCRGPIPLGESWPIRQEMWRKRDVWNAAAQALRDERGHCGERWYDAYEQWVAADMPEGEELSRLIDGARR